MKPPETVIRVGDWVEVVTPRVVTRVGYPKGVKDYEPEAERLIGSVIDKVFGATGPRRDRLIHEFAYALAHKDGFGGRERDLHFKDAPHLAEKTYCVTAVRSVQTGMYYPPQGGGGYGSDGEYEYESGGLLRRITRRLATLGLFTQFGRTVEVAVEDVRKLLPKN